MGMWARIESSLRVETNPGDFRFLSGLDFRTEFPLSISSCRKAPATIIATTLP